MILMFFDNTSGGPIYFVGPIIYICIGAILFGFANGISNFIIRPSEAQNDIIHLSTSEHTARIAFLILGIYILSYALPQLIQLSIEVGSYYIHIDEIPEHVRQQQPRWIILVAPFIRLLISAILIIGPNKVLKFLAKYDDTLTKINSPKTEG
jgi:hypothetical protein